jgi:threonine synthase
VGRYGLGCEPASAASVAGLKQLVADGVIGKDETVVCVLTGHLLKDPDLTVRYHRDKLGACSNRPVEAPNDIEAIIKLLK